MGDVYGYLNLPITSVCDQFVDLQGFVGSAFTTIQNAGIAAAKNAGINLNDYDSVMVMGPELQSCAIGEAAATIGGTPGYVLVKCIDPAAYVGQTFEQRYDDALAHEIGHNLGLYHAKFLYDGNAVYSGSVPSDACGNAPCYVEYGDYDVMGIPFQSKFHFNAAHKEFLGWLQPQMITTAGSYQIGPYEIAATATKALKILAPLADDTFYVEYRQPIGFHSELFSNGLLMHLGGGGGPSYLLNLNPADGHGILVDAGPPNPGLSSGATYVDYAKRFSVTSVGTTAESAQLRILVPGLDSPALAFSSPKDGATVSGATNISVDALDRSGILGVAPDQPDCRAVHLHLESRRHVRRRAHHRGHCLQHPRKHRQPANRRDRLAPTDCQPAKWRQLPANRRARIDRVSFRRRLHLPHRSSRQIPLPNNLGGASVTIAGQALPFFYVSSTQLNVQLPWNLPAGANSITVSGGGVSATGTFNVVPAAPGIFVYGNNLAVAQNQDYTLNSVSNPAKAGSYVTVYLTGIGPLDNLVGLGQATPSQPYSRATTSAQATVGGMPAQISFIGMTPGSVGLAQADIQIPFGLAPGTYPIQIQMGLDLPVLSNAPLIATN